MESTRYCTVLDFFYCKNELDIKICIKITINYKKAEVFNNRSVIQVNRSNKNGKNCVN